MDCIPRVLILLIFLSTSDKLHWRTPPLSEWYDCTCALVYLEHSGHINSNLLPTRTQCRGLLQKITILLRNFSSKLAHHMRSASGIASVFCFGLWLVTCSEPCRRQGRTGASPLPNYSTVCKMSLLAKFRKKKGAEEPKQPLKSPVALLEPAPKPPPPEVVEVRQKMYYYDTSKCVHFLL